jgi:signal transduction histidine kinase
MKIRNRLTFLFIVIVGILFVILSFYIYFFSADFRHEEFYRRLENRAISTARLLVDVDEVDANLLQLIEKSTPESLPSEKMTIIDYRNKAVFSTDESHVIRITTGMLNEIRLKNEVKYKQGDYEILGILFIGKYDRFVVVNAAIDKYGFRKLRYLKVILVIGFIITIILVSFAGWFFSGRAMAPISNVIKQVERITESSLNLRLDSGNEKDEIAQLSRTFNDMLNRLEAAFKMQKNFVSNASHELRTPLTSITGQLEVILMKKRAEEEYVKSINSVLEDIKNLNRISNGLLLLAQTSSDITTINLSPIRIDDLIWQARGELIKRNKEYIIIVLFDPSINDDKYLIANCNEQLIKAAIINLIDNGCKYSSLHEVIVKLLYPGGDYLTIEFHDKGIGIGKDEIKHIFEPFYRSKDALTVKGHGIGLSLVDRVVKLHNGSIKVESEFGKGSVFTLKIPYYRNY